ncbi:hypothetical protein Tco_0739092, partial [Tanacetum coccineum]
LMLSIKGLPSYIMVHKIPFMSAYVHGNTSALHRMSSCSFLLKLVAKNIYRSLQNAFLDLLLSLFYLVGFIGQKYNTNPMRSVEFHYCMDYGQYDPYLLHGCYSEEKIVWGIGPDDDKVQGFRLCVRAFSHSNFQRDFFERP